jgi:hypothetical protein
MVARGGLLFSDPFSLSAQGRAWTDVHWLFQLGVFEVHQWAGLSGIVLGKCALVGAGALLLLSAVRPSRYAAWAGALLAVWLVAALFVARSLLLVRPVIITLLCLALFLRELERFRGDGRARHLVLLGLVQVVWANCQGLSALGPAVAGAYLVEALVARRRWPALLGATFACALASLLTPFGWRGLALSGALFERLLPGEHNVYAHTVAENVPPFVLERWTGGELWHFKWYCLFLAAALLAGGRRLRVSHALLLAGFGALALLSNRNVLLFYWVSAPIAAIQLAPAARRWLRQLGPLPARWAPVAAASALLALIGLSSAAAARETSLAEPSPFRAPAESVSRLQALPAADVFCADHHGGYLIWRLFPRQRPYIDTRLVLRSADEYAEYLALADFPERFEAFQARHRFGYVLLPVDYPNRYLGLIAELYRSPQFRLVFTNGSEVLFARRDLAAGPGFDLSSDAQVSALEQQLSRRYADRPKLMQAAQLQLATLEISVGELQQAERTLGRQQTSESAALLDRVRYLRGDLDAAEASARAHLQREPADVPSLTLLSQIALARGQAALGARYLRRALAQSPFDTEASQLLTRLEAREP